MSATVRGAKAFESPDRPGLRDPDNSRDRFPFRNKSGEAENDRGGRDGRNNLLRPKRTEGDADSEGWSTVKPRKSFGTEGAERFNGRMGVDRHRDDRRFKDREDRDRDVKDRDRDRDRERPQRGFDTFQRDKDNDHDQDRDNRRNGMGRGRGESWRAGDDAPPTPRDRNSNGDRVGERSRGWRDKERDDRERGDRGDVDRPRGDRNDRDRGDRGDRRWGRDRPEVDPEWMDNPAEEKKAAHTQEDFEKWRQATKRTEEKSSGKTPAEEGNKGDNGTSFFGLEKQKVETPLAIDTGPDKFFGQWATPKDEAGPDSGIESKKEGAAKGKSGGKASRFTSFFAAPPEEPQRRQTEPPPMPPPAANGFAALLGGGGGGSNNTPNEEKAAFAQLLQKLHAQQISGSGSGTTPPLNGQQQPKPPALEKQQSAPPAPEQSFQQYRPERQEERPNLVSRNSQQTIQDLLSQRQVATSQPQIRTNQMVQDLVDQRQNALSQQSIRPDQPQSHNNTEFLMNLMRRAPEPQRTEQVLLRMAPQQRPSDRAVQQQMLEREQEMHREAAIRERSAAQRQARPQVPPGFYDDPSFQRGPPPQHERQPQPTQILQRPPPPGLDQMQQPSWAQPPQQQIRQQQHIAPPPGLPGGPQRNMPMQAMFPPGFPGFPPPDMGGAPRMQPPPGFYNAPPPQFMPPGMSQFQGPPGDGMPFPGYDGRGPPPNGAFRR